MRRRSHGAGQPDRRSGGCEQAETPLALVEMTKRERLQKDRAYRDYRLQWRREVEYYFDLKPAPELPEPGVYDLDVTDEG